MSSLLTEELREQETEHRERVIREPERGRRREPRREDRPPVEYITGGTVIEALAGLTAGVLSIIGLGGLFPAYMASISVLAVGVALLFAGGIVMARYSRILSEVSHVPPDVGGGVTTEFLAGVTGITLGILSLFGVVPLVLGPAAIIVFGCATILSGTSTYRLHNVSMLGRDLHTTPSHWVVREAVLAGIGTEVLIGVGVTVLGILALLGFDPRVLTFVGTLSLGTSILLGTRSLCAKVYGLLGL
jgi:hypothetical protein